MTATATFVCTAVEPCGPDGVVTLVQGMPARRGNLREIGVAVLGQGNVAGFVSLLQAWPSFERSTPPRMRLAVLSREELAEFVPGREYELTLRPVT